MKVKIRFLKQGLVDAVAPDDWAGKSDKEKKEWADQVLSSFDEKVLIRALSDTSSDAGGFFAASPEAEAIMSEEMDTLWCTPAWRFFAEESCSDESAMETTIKAFVLDKIFSERPGMDDDWDFFMNCNEYDAVEGFVACTEYETEDAYMLRRRMDSEYTDLLALCAEINKVR